MLAQTLRAAIRPVNATAPLGDIWSLIAAWRTVRRERRALASLDARLLRDIGVDESSRDAEAARPFWDVPTDRRP